MLLFLGLRACRFAEPGRAQLKQTSAAPLTSVGTLSFALQVTKWRVYARETLSVEIALERDGS